MSLKLITNRLILRDFTLEDQAAYLTFTADKKYQRFYSEEDCTPEKGVYLVSQFVSESKLTDRKNYNLAIIDRHTKTLIGVCGVRVEDNQQGSIGCGLSRHCHTSGLAREAVSCLMDFAFIQLNLHRLYAETISKNRAAIKLCLSVGMREEAKLIENRYFKSTWWSTSILAILKQEWQAASNRSL